ncbi:class I SAM-dependent methyltransferase [Ramlibacter sp. USB13]|uniref:Class I SAM-dependent methyltransferase n=1 Tax=Ramlibacter cellulosilyticus TaxID=2764187 RepID=A0A923MS77_9BURK|nr:class I SAM-dependent methyltransferase [Ramlibacter cellulosilyticus]MBC5784862.1 class I SAM-dependent methyltransferase [Ramlibacter cellulosilyticus]
MTARQRQLAAEQLEAFYSDRLTADQVQHFVDLTSGLDIDGHVVDVGGGCGHFARLAQRKTGKPVRVIDTDPKSVEACRAVGIEAVVGDALAPLSAGDEAVACFNLMLHHLVADNGNLTTRMQMQALTAWRGRVKYLFVHEYVYDSFLGDLSGKIIYAITSSKALSAVARQIGKIVPSLRANTFGVGVRFRSEASWIDLFRSAGFEVAKSTRGDVEPLPLPRRALLIRRKSRDSYLLIARN